jgi:hypothetical protein
MVQLTSYSYSKLQQVVGVLVGKVSHVTHCYIYHLGRVCAQRLLSHQFQHFFLLDAQRLQCFTDHKVKNP